MPNSSTDAGSPRRLLQAQACSVFGSRQGEGGRGIEQGGTEEHPGPIPGRTEGSPGRPPQACRDPRLRIRSVTFSALPDLLAALAGAPGALAASGLGSAGAPVTWSARSRSASVGVLAGTSGAPAAVGVGSGFVARALLAVFQRGRQVWSGAVLGVWHPRPNVWLVHEHSFSLRRCCEVEDCICACCFRMNSGQKKHVRVFPDAGRPFLLS